EYTCARMRLGRAFGLLRVGVSDVGPRGGWADAADPRSACGSPPAGRPLCNEYTCTTMRLGRASRTRRRGPCRLPSTDVVLDAAGRHSGNDTLGHSGNDTLETKYRFSDFQTLWKRSTTLWKRS